MKGIQYGPGRWYGANPPCIREPWITERRGAMEKPGGEGGSYYQMQEEKRRAEEGGRRRRFMGK